jgi:flagellar hook protein FlgE
MLSALTTGVSGLEQFQEQMNVIGNNIANVNTTGFKGARVEFADNISQTLGAAGGANAAQIGSGVNTSTVRNLFTQGDLTSTSVDTDLAISGSGFFVVRDTNTNQQYVTRAGAFVEDGNGYLVVSNRTNLRVQGYSDSALGTIGDVRLDSTDQIAADTAAAQTALTTATTANTTAAANLATAQTASDAAAKAATDANAALQADPTNAGLQTAYTDAQTAATTAAATLATAKAAANTAASQLSGATANLAAATNASRKALRIDATGKVNLTLTDGTQFVRGQVLLQNFTTPEALIKEGGNLYSGIAGAGPIGGTTPLPAAAGTNGLGTIQADNLEMSNVDLSSQLTSLITAQRAFQASARIVTTSDEVLQEVVNLKR